MDQWSGGYYSVSESGDLLVKPDGAEAGPLIDSQTSSASAWIPARLCRSC